MIRDPSDGSVKEADTACQKSVIEARLQTNPEGLLPVSGLPLASTKPEHVERLERSRKQLEHFRKTGEWNDAT